MPALVEVSGIFGEFCAENDGDAGGRTAARDRWGASMGDPLVRCGSCCGCWELSETATQDAFDIERFSGFGRVKKSSLIEELVCSSSSLLKLVVVYILADVNIIVLPRTVKSAGRIPS